MLRGGPGRVRGAPLGDVLTPRERALLRTADAVSGRLPGEEEPLRQPLPLQGHRQRPRELLEAHERQVAAIRARTQQLERQREGRRWQRFWGNGEALWDAVTPRRWGCGDRAEPPAPHCPSGLCRRLATLGARAPLGPQPQQGEPEPSQGPPDQAGQVRTAQHRAALHLDTLLPPAGPLAAEARALRLSYLRSGGHDPAILDQLLHLQLEATVLEKGTAGLRRGRRMAEAPSTGTDRLDAALLAVELENRRLEDELLALKVRRERRANAGSQAAQQHTEELAQLQAEVGMLRCHAEQTRPRLHSPVCPHAIAHPLPPALAVPELFMVRASVHSYFQLSEEGRRELGLGFQLGQEDRSPPGQHWGLAGPQPICPPATPSPPLWPWRTLLLLRSPQHETGLPEGEPGIGHGPTRLPCHPFHHLQWQNGAPVTVSDEGNAKPVFELQRRV
ncbi:hypothetical protein Nmel_011243 [Mimus melanotis]